MKKKRAGRYPWDKWLSQKKTRLLRGKHYECMTHSMSVLARIAAQKRGIQVSVHIDDRGLTIYT